MPYWTWTNRDSATIGLCNTCVVPCGRNVARDDRCVRAHPPRRRHTTCLNAMYAINVEEVDDVDRHKRELTLHRVSFPCTVHPPPFCAYAEWEDGSKLFVPRFTGFATLERPLRLSCTPLSEPLPTSVEFVRELWDDQVSGNGCAWIESEARGDV